MIQESLGQGLVLRAVRDERDVAAFADLHTRYVSAAEGVTCSRLMQHHPENTYDDFLVVEDQQTGQLVSTVCLIPWRFSFEGVPLRAAMLEMVVTHPDYRRRGLVRALIERFHRHAAEGDYDLCFIEGIPYYYRQFGYTYAIDHRSYDALPVAAVPAEPAGRPAAYSFRPATLDDAPALSGLYDAAMKVVPLHVARDTIYWRFLLEQAEFPVRVAMDRRTGAPVGYAAVFPPDAAGRVTVLESAVNDDEAGMALLRALRCGDGATELQPGVARLRCARPPGAQPGERPFPDLPMAVPNPRPGGLPA